MHKKINLVESSKFLTISLTSHPSCRTLSDELSRLWRLAILSPGIPTKQRQGVIDQLRTLNQTGTVYLGTRKKGPVHVQFVG